MNVSSVVIVGVGFERQLFDEREIFPEPMGRDYTAWGHVGDYSYGPDKTCRFVVSPEKILLFHTSGTILSDTLMNAACLVAGALKSRSQGHGVSGLGFNFKAVFSQSESGLSGREFCRGLYNVDRIQQAIGSSFHDSECRVVVDSGGVRYTLRLQAHSASSEANLFLGVNGHQDIAPSDNMESELSRAASAREYILSVYRSLSREFEGKRDERSGR